MLRRLYKVIFWLIITPIALYGLGILAVYLDPHKVLYNDGKAHIGDYMIAGLVSCLVLTIISGVVILISFFTIWPLYTYIRDGEAEWPGS